jgi:hypothetical protein
MARFGLTWCKYGFAGMRYDLMRKTENDTLGQSLVPLFAKFLLVEHVSFLKDG